MPAFLQLSDVANLTYGPPPATVTAQASIGSANANQLTGVAMYEAIASNYGRLILPEQEIVLAVETAGQASGQVPIYVSAAQKDLSIHCENTKFWLAGTDRTNYTGLITWANCVGIQEFVGKATIDFINSPFLQGIVTGISGTNPKQITIQADHPITWTDFRIATLITRDAMGARPTQRVLVNSVADTTKAGIPIAAGSGTNVYVISVSNTSYDGSSLISVGSELQLQHITSIANLFNATNTEKVRVGRDIRVLQSCGALGSFLRTSWDIDCTAEGGVLYGSTRSVNRLMSVNGGVVGGQGKSPSNFRATIVGCGDDFVDANAVPLSIAGFSTSAGTVTVNNGNNYYVPALGDFVSFVDPNGIEQATGPVTAASNPSTSTTTLTFASIPAAITTAWSVIDATISQGVVIHSEARLERGWSAGVRVSGEKDEIKGSSVKNALGPGLEYGSGLFAEYAASQILRVGQSYFENVNIGIGTPETQAAVVIRPTLASGAVAGAGALKLVQLEGFTVNGTNGLVLAAGGIGLLEAGPIRGTRCSLAPSALGSFAASAAVLQLENITEAIFSDIDVRDGNGNPLLILNCLNVGKLFLPPTARVTLPTSGVANLVAPGRWQPFATTVSADSGTPAATVQSNRFKWDGSSCRLQGRIDVAQPASTGSASFWGGKLAITVPRTSTYWAAGVVYDVAGNKAGTISISAGGTTAYLYGNGASLAGGVNTNEVFFFEIEYEAT